MQKRIIDLRDVPLPTVSDIERMGRPAGPHPNNAVVQPDKNNSNNSNSEAIKPLIEWTALEYPLQERGPYWYLPPSAGALACVLFAILVRSYLFAGFAVLALCVALLYAKRAPRPYRFAISREGVYIGEKRHRFAELKSFWILEHEQGPELSLETASGRIFPYLYLPLGDTHPNRIRRVLSDFLPEKEHAELFTDQIARSIGF